MSSPCPTHETPHLTTERARHHPCCCSKCSRLCRRLPNLDTVSITLESDFHPGPLGTLLINLQQQLTSVKSLILCVEHSWAHPQAPWRELGTATQLTALEVEFGTQVRLAISIYFAATTSIHCVFYRARWPGQSGVG